MAREMATISAILVPLLLVTSLCIGAESYPDGCEKMRGSPKDGLPNEFIVKIYHGAIENVMLELNHCDHEGKFWRTSNTPDSLMKPITCSSMYLVNGFGFFAKLSDAAVMWLCDNVMVEYIEPNYLVTISPATKSPTDDFISTEDSGSGNVTSVSVVTDTEDGSGFSTTVVPTSTHSITSAATSTATTSSISTISTSTVTTCIKLHGDLLVHNDYLIMFNYNLLDFNMDNLYALIEEVKKVDPTFSTSLIKPLVGGSKRGFYYEGLSEKAVLKFCESVLVDYIQVQREASTAQPTTTTTTTTKLTMKPTPSSLPNPPNNCNKIGEYKQDSGQISYRYIVILHRNTSTTFIHLFINEIQNQSYKPVTLMKVKNVQLLLNLRMFTAEMNKKAMEYVCGNPAVKWIEYDTVVTVQPQTPSPTTIAPTSSVAPQCMKVRGGKLKSIGFNLVRIYMKTISTKKDCVKFVTKMEALDKAPDNNIRFVVTSVSHHKYRPMIVARLSQDAVYKICQFQDIDLIIKI